jgi:catalase
VRVKLLAKWAVIGAVVLIMAAAFAYVGGWLSTARLTPSRMMMAFQAAAGLHPGFRRNHAKGVCVSGWFEGNGQAIPWSKAAVFEPGRVPLIGRFALAGGLPFQSDLPGTVRSMALRLLPGNGEEWRTGMNNIPVFPVNSAQGFNEQLLASKADPATGKADPAAMQRFLIHHPESVRALAIIKSRVVSSEFADTTFNSLDAFRFVNAIGTSFPVRWAAVPLQQGAAPENTGDGAKAGENYLFDDLIAQLHRHPLQWRLMVIFGEAGDSTADATLPWPAERRQIDAGIVTIDRAFGEDERVSSEGGGSCADINFDPLVLPSGIVPSDDPLLSARSAVYARSFTLRTSEKLRKAPSAVAP